MSVKSLQLSPYRESFQSTFISFSNQLSFPLSRHIHNRSRRKKDFPLKCLHDFELHSWEALSASPILPALSPTFHSISSHFSINNLVTLPYHVSVLSMSEASSPPQHHCWEPGEEWEAIFFPSCLKYLYTWGWEGEKINRANLAFFITILLWTHLPPNISVVWPYFISAVLFPSNTSSSPCVWITSRKYFCLASISLSLYICIRLLWNSALIICSF